MRPARRLPCCRTPLRKADARGAHVCLLLYIALLSLHIFEDLIDGKAGCLLTWRELLEGPDKLRSELLGAHYKEGVIQDPIPIGVGIVVRSLKWIGS
jgi:hypothetical protein